MYLEIDEGYWAHPKTLDLCARLEDSKADTYPPRMWKWAVRSARTGQLGAISAYAIEKAVQYEPMDGRCAAALIGAGFIDKHEDGTMEIHDWMDYTGGALKRMEDKAEENRKRRADAKAKHDAKKGKNRGNTEEAPYRNRTSTNPSQTRPDQTSQDKTRETNPPSARTGACEPQAKIRPRTAHELILCLRVAIQREQPENGMWNPGGSFAHKEADDFLRGFGDDLEAALDTIERRIELFAKDREMRPWTVAKFAKAYNGIGAPKAINGKPAPMQARY